MTEQNKLEQNKLYYFDQIFILNYTNDINRVNNVKNLIDKLGIKDITTIFYTSKYDVNEKIGNYLTSIHTTYYDKYNNYGSVFDCSRNHCNIINCAYNLGYEKILILEDDVIDIQLNVVNDLINNIPQNWDILLFLYGGDYINYGNNINLRLNNNDWWVNAKGINCFRCCAMYALNRSGMRILIDEFNKNFGVCDMYFEKISNDCNIYLANRQMPIQFILSSSIAIKMDS